MRLRCLREDFRAVMRCRYALPSPGFPWLLEPGSLVGAALVDVSARRRCLTEASAVRGRIGDTPSANSSNALSVSTVPKLGSWVHAPEPPDPRRSARAASYTPTLIPSARLRARWGLR